MGKIWVASLREIYLASALVLGSGIVCVDEDDVAINLGRYEYDVVIPERVFVKETSSMAKIIAFLLVILLA